MNRQVRIEGTAEALPDEEARQYFESRPKKSQIAAAISLQSRPIESRQTMIDKYTELDEKYSEASFIPKPAIWGGFLVKPHKFEFWQGQSSRLHDRIVFRRLKADDAVDGNLLKAAEDGWFMERLQP